MRHTLNCLLLTLSLLFVGISNVWGEEYSFTILASDFTTTSYADNNKSHTSNATCSTDASKKVTVVWTSNQVYQNSSSMQWQKNTGYIYNTTDLGTIKSVTVNSTEGSFTTYYGTSEHPTSETTVGGGFFSITTGNATGKTSSIVVVFEKTEKIVNSISLINSDIKVNYEEDDFFDPTGLKILASYTDGTSEEIEYNTSNKTKFSFKPSLSTKLTTSDTSVSITFAGKTVSQPISVKELPTWTTHFYINGQLTDIESKKNRELTIPEVTTTLGFTFMGWIRNSLEETDEEPTYTILGKTKYTPTQDGETFYSVYKRSEREEHTGYKLSIKTSKNITYYIGERKSTNNYFSIANNKDDACIFYDKNNKLFFFQGGNKTFFYAESNATIHFTNDVTSPKAWTITENEDGTYYYQTEAEFYLAYNASATRFATYSKKTAEEQQYPHAFTKTAASEIFETDFYSTLAILPAQLTSITVSGAKVTYNEDEKFATEELIVTAHYDNETSREIEGWTIDNTDPLSVEDTKVTVSYTERGITKTCDIIITVTPKPRYSITWYVNGIEYTEGNPTTTVKEGGRISVLPTKPISPDATSKTFMGWTNEPIAEKQENAPDVLFKTASEAPVIYENMDFYAVFAKSNGNTFTKVTSTNDLEAGDQVLIVYEGIENNKAAGTIGTSTYFSAEVITISDGRISSLGGNISVFTLDGEPGAWTLTSEEGTVGCTGDGQSSLLSTTGGVITWDINISYNSEAHIKNTQYNTRYIKYNQQSPRFTTYKIETDKTAYPQLYKSHSYTDYITEIEQVECTITWSINGDESQAHQFRGSTLIIPNVEETRGKVFYGWVTDPSLVVYNKTPKLANINEKTTVKKDATYYAVFATEIPNNTSNTSYFSIIEGDTIPNGDYYIVDTYGDEFYTMSGAVVNGKIPAEIITKAVTTNSDGTITLHPESGLLTTDMIYNITKDDNNYVIRNIVHNSLVAGSTTSNDLTKLTSKPWTGIEWNENNRVSFLNSYVSTNKKGVKTTINSCLLLQANTWDGKSRTTQNSQMFRDYNQEYRDSTAEKGQHYGSGYFYLIPAGSTYSDFITNFDSVDITVSAYGYTTYSCNKAYKMPKGLTGRTVYPKKRTDAGFNLHVPETYPAGALVPIGESLLLQGEANKTYTLLQWGVPDEPKTKGTENCLYGEYGEKETDGYLTTFGADKSNDYYYYKLTTKTVNGVKDFGWYWGKDDGQPFYMSRNDRAYMVLPKEVGNEIKAWIYDIEEDNIETNLDSATSKEFGNLYDLSGRHVKNKPSRGIYIMAGRKYIAK